MNEEIKFDTNEDILFQIAMITYERHNSTIASINDNLGDMYSYKDLEEAEKCELEDEKHLLELAIKQLQQENQQLKSQLEQSKNETKQRDDVIDKSYIRVQRILDYYNHYKVLPSYILDELIELQKDLDKFLIEELNKRGGTDE